VSFLSKRGLIVRQPEAKKNVGWASLCEGRYFHGLLGGGLG